MPWGLKRFHASGQTHFITFSCYHRLPFLTSDSAKRVFENALQRARFHYGLYVYAYVVMPEHVHILVSEPQRETLAVAMKSLKQGVSRKLISNRVQFWQKRYYDLNVKDHEQFLQKLRYIHRNPAKRGLCRRPRDWEWSSFLQYVTGCDGRVEIECEMTARRREREAGRLAPAIELPHSTEQRG